MIGTKVKLKKSMAGYLKTRKLYPRESKLALIAGFALLSKERNHARSAFIRSSRHPAIYWII